MWALSCDESYILRVVTTPRNLSITSWRQQHTKRREEGPTCLNSSKRNSTLVIPDLRTASATSSKLAFPYMHRHGDPAMRSAPLISEHKSLTISHLNKVSLPCISSRCLIILKSLAICDLRLLAGESLLSQVSTRKCAWNCFLLEWQHASNCNNTWHQEPRGWELSAHDAE